MYSFEQLRGFVAVADELHFGRAAERLNMTQPPLSRMIQKLEREIGVRLFDRDNRGVAITAAGQAFLAEAKRLLALADSAPDLARRISRGSVGTVRIGFTAGSAYGVLPGLLDHLSRTVPDIDLDLYEMVTREQIDALLTHRIDLGLARPPFDPAEFRSRVVKREELVVVVPAGHRLAERRRPLRPEDLASEPLIMYTTTQARYFYDLVVGIVPVVHDNVVHTVSQILTVVWLVSAGRGIGFVPRSASLLGIEGVRYVSMRTVPPRPVELHMLWPRESDNRALGAALHALEGYLTDL